MAEDRTNIWKMTSIGLVIAAIVAVVTGIVVANRTGTQTKVVATGADAVHFHTAVYEGFAPHRVPVMVECLTDNNNRTATEVKMLFKAGNLGTPGSVGW